MKALSSIVGINPTLAAAFTTKDYVDTGLAGKQPLDTDLTAFAALAPTNDDVLQRKAGDWTNRTPAQLKIDLAIAQADVSGLVTALAGKQPLDADLTTIAGLTVVNDSILQGKAGAWAVRTMAQLRTDLAFPRAQLRQTVAQTLTNSSWSSITFDTETIDVGAGHSTISNTSRWTWPATGHVLVAGAVSFTSSAGFKATRWAVNGAAVPTSQLDGTSGIGAEWPVAARTMWISGAAGDYLELQAYQETGAGLLTGVFADAASSMSVWFIG